MPAGRGLAVADLVRPLLGPGAPARLALWRLDLDPLAGMLIPPARLEIVEAAQTAGRAVARRARQRGWRPAEEALRADGVALAEVDGGEVAGPLVFHARYAAPPPSVTLYRRPIAALGRLLGAERLRALLGEVDPREVILAHELFHHLAWRDGAPPGSVSTVERLRIGRWRRVVRVAAAEEIAAASFATAWRDLPWPAELLDCLTLLAWRPPEGEALLRALAAAPAP